ncbi:MAG: hypothetical protein WA771_10970 [Chthoniobacterales bacterium]
MSPSSQRCAVKLNLAEGWSKSTAAACRTLGLARLNFHRENREAVESRRIHKEVWPGAVQQTCLVHLARNVAVQAHHSRDLSR